MKYLHDLAALTPHSVTPNHLSWFRIWSVPLLWLLYLLHPAAAFALYFFACISDWLDGHLARTRGLISEDGKKLDERSDKVLAAGVLGLLFADNIIWFNTHSTLFWCVVVIVIRECAVTTLREVWPERARRIPSLPSAKWKTTIMMMGFGLLIFGGIPHPLFQNIADVGVVLVGVSALLAVWSGVRYAILFREAGK